MKSEGPSREELFKTLSALVAYRRHIREERGAVAGRAGQQQDTATATLAKIGPIVESAEEPALARRRQATLIAEHARLGAITTDQADTDARDDRVG